MATRVSDLWIKPLETDPALMVDREASRVEAKARLLDVIDSPLDTYRILVTGDRGMGKSIFSKWLLHEADAHRGHKVLTLAIDGRAITLPQFFKEMCRKLADGIRGQPDLAALGRWVDELTLLATQDQITRTHSDNLARKYGVQGGTKVSLFEFFSVRHLFTWDETRSSGDTVATQQVVNEALLQAAIQATLSEVSRLGHKVVVLFDDLDQAHVQDLKSAIKRVLDLQPCIALVHLRTEAVDADVRREIADHIEVGPLDDDAHHQMLLARAATADLQAHLNEPSLRAALRRLADVSPNPYALLKWTSALLRTQEIPLSPDWTSAAALHRLVRKAAITDVDDETLRRLASLIDRCAGADGTARRADLLRGARTLDHQPAWPGLQEAEFGELVRMGLLVPTSHHQSDPNYRLDPLLELLRPSVQRRLTG